MYIKRERYLAKIRPFYDVDLIKVLTGVRRCGKSVLLTQIRDELSENGVDAAHIIEINFENIEFMGRSFAQEYLNQKHFASFEVIEENIPEDVEKMFDIILKLNNKK